MYQVFRQ